MTGSARHEMEFSADASSIVAAFAGSPRDVQGLFPAIVELQRAFSSASIWLLWPADIGCPKTLMAAVAGRVDYPLPKAEQPNEVCAAEIIERLAACRADVAIVFNGACVEPYTPAYYCYLAGIPVRAGASVEFGGAVLSHVLRIPDEGTRRHVALLRKLGIGSRYNGTTRPHDANGTFAAEDRCDL